MPVEIRAKKQQSTAFPSLAQPPRFPELSDMLVLGSDPPPSSCGRGDLSRGLDQLTSRDLVLTQIPLRVASNIGRLSACVSFVAGIPASVGGEAIRAAFMCKEL